MVGPPEYRLQPYGITIEKPSPEWALFIDERVKEFGNNAVAVVIKQAGSPEAQRIGVLTAEKIPAGSIAKMTLPQITESIMKSLNFNREDTCVLPTDAAHPNVLRMITRYTPQDAPAELAYVVTVLLFPDHIVQLIAVGQS